MNVVNYELDPTNELATRDHKSFIKRVKASRNSGRPYRSRAAWYEKNFFKFRQGTLPRAEEHRRRPSGRRSGLSAA